MTLVRAHQVSILLKIALNSTSIYNKQNISQGDDDDEDETLFVDASNLQLHSSIGRQGSNKIMRLSRSDMGLFGLFPETDRFVGVVCGLCCLVIKPQGLQKHVESRHQGNNANNHYQYTSSTSGYTGNIGVTISSSESSSSSHCSHVRKSPPPTEFLSTGSVNDDILFTLDKDHDSESSRKRRHNMEVPSIQVNLRSFV